MDSLVQNPAKRARRIDMSRSYEATVSRSAAWIAQNTRMLENRSPRCNEYINQLVLKHSVTQAELIDDENNNGREKRNGLDLVKILPWMKSWRALGWSVWKRRSRRVSGSQTLVIKVLQESPTSGSLYQHLLQYLNTATRIRRSDTRC